MLASDLNTISALLSNSFDYETGTYENVDKLTPAKPFLVKTDYNLNNSNKISFRYSQLNSSTDVLLSTSSSLGFGRNSGTNTNFLGYKNSNYSILENYKSGIGEWNSTIGTTMSNSLTVGYTTNDESRGDVGTLFPFIDILDGAGVAYTSVGSEPFTPNNELRYNTFQLQDNFTKYTSRHSLTFGVSLEKYNSENVFFPGKQSSYVYNSLADFYTDLNGYLANPNRTTSPVSLRRFQVRYSNIPGQEKPIQPLEVWYTGGYAQDVWRPKSNVTLTAGIRMDVPIFGDTAYPNANADLMTFRDETGAAVQDQTGKLPNSTPLWSPRLGFNWDVSSDQTTQIRGGTGVFTGKPAYVWISNQIGNTGVLTGFIQDENVTSRPFHPNPDFYKPATVTGAPAASVELNVSDPDFKFPQTWRTNIGVDHKLPWGMIGTGGVHLQQGRERRVLLQRQSAGRADDVRRRGQPPALDRDILRDADAWSVRHAPQQHRGQRHHQRGRAEESGYRPVVEPRGQPLQDAPGRLRVQGGLQLRRVAEHDRCRLGGRRIVHQQPDQRRSQQPRVGVFELLAGSPCVPHGFVHASSTSTSAARRSPPTGKRARSATPATSSPAT